MAHRTHRSRQRLSVLLVAVVAGAVTVMAGNVPAPRVLAGRASGAEEHIEELLPIPPAMLPNGGGFFALRVRGDSMTGARILDGDTVVVRAAQAADHGDIVAALLDETEATVKRLHHGGRASSWLMPANNTYQPISAANARILGKVVAVLRKVESSRDDSTQPPGRPGGSCW